MSTLSEAILAHMPGTEEQPGGDGILRAIGSLFPQRVDDRVEETAASFQPLHSNVSPAAPRDCTRLAPVPEERLRTAHELAESAAGAIHGLRTLADDENLALAREARRLLRELGVWLED